MNHPPVSFDLNSQHLCVFGTRNAVEGQTACRALGLVQRSVLVAGGQLGLQRAPVPGGAALLSSWAAPSCRSGLALAMFALLALAGEYASLQITYLTACQVQLSLQCGVGLDASHLEFTQNALVPKLAPLEAINGFAVQRLPIMCGRLQRYVLLLGDRHKRVCRRWQRHEAGSGGGFCES
jgi:hypothetical protein